MKKLIGIGLGICLMLAACKKEDPVVNPFDGQDLGNSGNNSDTLDPISIAGLHKQIFSVRCANPLCHDGSFEPDFRTIQSTYNNLVYHEVVKNNAANDFTFRVIPYDTENSWLIERLTTDDVVLGRMPLYADPLSDKQLSNIKAWINDGCKDVNGIPAQYPNLMPRVITRVALNTDLKRIDTLMSNGPFSPFVLKPNTDVNLAFIVEDDSTSPENLSLNQVKFSYDKEDFTNATSLTATHYTQNYFLAQFNTDDFNAGVPIYFRYYVKDEHHADPTEFPESGSPIYFKDSYAFIVQ